MSGAEDERAAWALLVEALREAQGLSRGELAASANVPYSTLANIESGRRVPSPRTASAVVSALGVELDALPDALEAAGTVVDGEAGEQARDAATEMLTRWMAEHARMSDGSKPTPSVVEALIASRVSTVAYRQIRRAPGPNDLRLLYTSKHHSSVKSGLWEAASAETAEGQPNYWAMLVGQSSGGPRDRVAQLLKELNDHEVALVAAYAQGVLDARPPRRGEQSSEEP